MIPAAGPCAHSVRPPTRSCSRPKRVSLSDMRLGETWLGRPVPRDPEIGYKSVDDLAADIVACKVQYGKLPDIVARFRLHPPSKGYKGKIKKGFKAGGEAGYRGEAINKLVQRMV